jgi:flavin-dependent dehydrogenase
MYDVIIIGSGIAGSYIAGKLKKFNVLVIEKEKGIKIKDSGIVSEGIFDFFKGNKLIKDKINKIRFVSQTNSLTIEREKIAYILEREELSEFLRNKSEGKTIFEKAKEIKCFDGFISVSTNEHEYRTKLLIGADGANSIARKAVTNRSPSLCIGILNKTNEIHHDCVHVYLNKYFSPDFFSWIIPQNNEYGLITAIRPMEYYNYFKKKMNLPDGNICGSFIPIGMTKSYSNRIMLVGDSCGQTKPLTGGGIIFSLKAAEYALETIENAFEEDRFDERILSGYEKKWKKDFGFEIRKQLFLRKLYRKMTNKQIDEMLNIFVTMLERLDDFDFDYDKPTKLWVKMPKLKLLRFLLGYLF